MALTSDTSTGSGQKPLDLFELAGASGEALNSPRGLVFSFDPKTSGFGFGNNHLEVDAGVGFNGGAGASAIHVD